MSRIDPRHDPRSDEELVAAANGGEAAALEAIYLRYRDWAASLAFRFTGDREAAQDVVQEAFTYLLRKFPGFVLRARLTTVLYPAVKNSALAMKRKKSPLLPGKLDEGAGGMTPVAAEGAMGGAGERGAALAAAIGRLPDGQREALLMRVVDEMSVAEIALALGVPEGTVKSRLHHAIKTLAGDSALRAEESG